MTISTRASLYESLLAADDVEAQLVLADALQDLGDPRGRLIAVQIGLEKDPWNAELQREEVRIIEQHAQAFLGPLALHRYDDGLELNWRRGFVRGAAFDEKEQASERLLDELLRIPLAENLTTVRVGRVGDYTACVGVLIAHRPALTELSLGMATDGDALFEDFDLRPVLQALPTLETFVCAGGRVGTLDLPRLRHFELHYVTDPHALVTARWPLLESLRLANLDGEGDLRPLIDSLTATALHGLALGLNYPYDDLAGGADVLVRHLAQSALLPRLRHLELGGRGLRADGAEVIAEILAHAAAFSHLDTLVLGHVQATETQREALQRIARNVRIGGGRRYRSSSE